MSFGLGLISQPLELVGVSLASSSKKIDQTKLSVESKGAFFELETDILKGLGTFSSSMEVGKAKSRPEIKTLTL